MKSRSFWTRALALATSGVVALTGIVPAAVAGPGFALGYSRNANPAGPPDVVEPTYYASSPLGLRPDPLGGPNSPLIDTGTAMRKFVDILPSVPGLAPTTNAGTGVMPNGDSKYIPLAVPTPWPSDNADYYHLAVVEYAEQLHSDLPKASTLRGYVQIEEPGLAAAPAGSKHIPLNYPNGQPIRLPDANGVQQQVYGYDVPHYLGPMIVATKGVATRIKYSNLLPAGGATGTGASVVRNGDLPLPVDATLAGGALQQNRIDIHLHGGLTPWISDGNPHQWTIPVGDTRFGFLNDIAVTASGSGYTAASTTVTIDPPQSGARGTAVLNAQSGVAGFGTLVEVEFERVQARERDRGLGRHELSGRPDRDGLGADGYARHRDRDGGREWHASDLDLARQWRRALWHRRSGRDAVGSRRARAGCRERDRAQWRTDRDLDGECRLRLLDGADGDRQCPDRRRAGGGDSDHQHLHRWPDGVVRQR